MVSINTRGYRKIGFLTTRWMYLREGSPRALVFTLKGRGSLKLLTLRLVFVDSPLRRSASSSYLEDTASRMISHRMVDSDD